MANCATDIGSSRTVNSSNRALPAKSSAIDPTAMHARAFSALAIGRVLTTVRFRACPKASPVADGK